MLNRFLFLALAAGVCLTTRGAILPPEKLLPRETALVVTIPDFAAGWSFWTNSPFGQLTQDPQLKPFKDKFLDKLSTDGFGPFEHTLGLHFSDLQDVARGQMTFAILPTTDPARPDVHFSKIFLLDTKEKSDQLKTNLAQIRQKWTAAGKPLKTHKIREIDFSTLVLGANDFSSDKTTPAPRSPNSPLLEDDADKSATNKTEITFGQVDSLLLVSDSPAAIEKVLSRQAGGLVPALEEQPVFQGDYNARLRGAPLYAWMNVKSVIDSLTKTSAGDSEDSAATAAVRPDSMLGAAGLTGLTSASFTYKSTPEGLVAQLFVGVPEGKRRGLLKAFVNETKDANPPPFVPADAVKYWRWRIDIAQTWKQLESMLNELNPQYGSVINFVLQSAGKDKDEKYDLKSQLLNNLGDDIIHYEKAPRGNTLADLNSPPSIYLIGSPNPEKLAAALKTGMSLMGTTKDREFLGRQISTVTTAAQGAAASHSFSFAGSGAYVAISDNGEILEEYLRSNENKGKALAETPGLADAAQKAGGMATGLFGYENQNAGMRSVFETLRTQPVALQDIIGTPSVPGAMNPVDQVAKLREWTDFTLLPPYDSIAKYFYFSVYAGSFSSEGFTVNYFSPTPPKLR